MNGSSFFVSDLMTHTSIGTISAASLVTLLTAGCASAPPAARPTTDPNLALDMKIEQKVSLLLQLEDRRILKAPSAPAPAPAPAAPARGRARTTVAPSPAPVVPPDLTSLLADAEPRVRRRAALALGRVGLVLGGEHELQQRVPACTGAVHYDSRTRPGGQEPPGLVP